MAQAACKDFKKDVCFKTKVVGTLKTPFRIYKAVGEVSYMRPSMIELIRQKVRAMENRLCELMRSWWRCKALTRHFRGCLVNAD
jgi:hypothetical protein